MAPATSPRRFYLLTSPRTASNLLVKILAPEDQEHILSCEREGYFFMPTIPPRYHDPKTAGRHLDEWKTEERSIIWDSYQVSFDDLQKHVESAEQQGKDVFVKEHLYWMLEPVAETKFVYREDSTKEVPWIVKTPLGVEQSHSPLNKTILLDEFLKTWLPTFLIRHPALAFPSNYRTHIDNWKHRNTESLEMDSQLLALEMNL